MLARIEQWDPNTLNDHPLNVQLYGDEVDPDLVESVRAHGVLVPITVTSDLTVVSGHRRRKAAIAAGLSAVPCLVQPIGDPDQVEQALIESNRQREKTNVQKAREAAHLLEIEKRRAAKRVEATQAKPGEKVGRKAVATLPPPTKQGENANSAKSRDKIGAVVGMSGRTVEAAVEVVQKIDEAKASGDTEKAEKLATTMNTKGVATALREARKPEPTPAPAADDITGEVDLRDDEPDEADRVAEALELGKEFDRLNREVRGVMRRMKELGERAGGVWLDPNKWQEVEGKLSNGLSAFMAARPHNTCPYCVGVGCSPCRESGYVTKLMFDSAPESKRKAVES